MIPRISLGSRLVRILPWVVLSSTVLYMEVQAQTQAYRPVAASDVSQGVNLADEGITLNQGSHISLRKAPEGVFVQVLRGEVLLNTRETALPPMIVRAGNAQIRDFDAAVCVGMEGGVASIEVIHGVARVGNIDSKSRVVNEVTLEAGDRVEISGSPAAASIRFVGRNGATPPCRWGM